MTVVHPFHHLRSLTDGHGTFEHADHAAARVEHGYCVDDMARVLVVASREQDPPAEVIGLARLALRFLVEAQGTTGRTRNRRSADGRWHGRRGVADCWGRSLWGLGSAAARFDGQLGSSARAHFDHAAQQRSPWPRAMAFAALGAAAVAGHDPSAARARRLLGDGADVLLALGPGPSREWIWPEARLTYANATLPDALLAAGAVLDRPDATARGIELLGWLLDRELQGGHLSVTAVGGAGPDDVGPSFDQQPIEVAALADACARAARLTGERRWLDGVRAAGAWFDGANDAGAVMWDPGTGGGYDGLHPHGPNQNQGAESTLALIATRQHLRTLQQAAL